jgi:hypothetical protein
LSLSFSAASAVFRPPSAPYFISPNAAGRRIVCGFSYIQRIGKSAATEVWFPSSLHEKVAARVLAGDASVLDEFQVEWAAVRQFELMQEADNFYIYDLKVEHFTRAYEDIMKMRAKGHRITVVTMGKYVEPVFYDELRILDERLQVAIAQIIQMLYLEEQSLAETGVHRRALREGAWDFAGALPHVAMTLGAADLFGREDDKSVNEKGKTDGQRGKSGAQGGGNGALRQHKQRLSQHFFRILDLLSRKHITHDVAVGLALPEAQSRQNWVYCAPGEYQYHAFQTALATVFRSFDHISLGALHERAGAGREAMPVMHHMRGYGDRCGAHDNQNREAAAFLREAGALGLN